MVMGESWHRWRDRMDPGTPKHSINHLLSLQNDLLQNHCLDSLEIPNLID